MTHQVLCNYLVKAEAHKWCNINSSRYRICIRQTDTHIDKWTIRPKSPCIIPVVSQHEVKWSATSIVIDGEIFGARNFLEEVKKNLVPQFCWACWLLEALLDCPAAVGPTPTDTMCLCLVYYLVHYHLQTHWGSAKYHRKYHRIAINTSQQ